MKFGDFRRNFGQIASDVQRLGLEIVGDALKFPVYSTVDGSDMAQWGADIMPALIRSISRFLDTF